MTLLTLTFNNVDIEGDAGAISRRISECVRDRSGPDGEERSWSVGPLGQRGGPGVVGGCGFDP